MRSRKDHQAVSEELDPVELEKTLLGIERRTRLELEEKGVNILFLAFGLLHWKSPDDQQNSSPLLLLPVELQRESVRDPHQVVSEDLEIAVNLAGTLAEQLKYEEAESQFKQVLAAMPDMATAHEGLGKLYVNLKKYTAANEHLTQAVELRPDSFSGHALLGHCRIHHADILGAVEAFERSHAILPFNDAVASNYLFFMAFHPGYDSQRHYELSTVVLESTSPRAEMNPDECGDARGEGRVANHTCCRRTF